MRKISPFVFLILLGWLVACQTTTPKETKTPTIVEAIKTTEIVTASPESTATIAEVIIATSTAELTSSAPTSEAKPTTTKTPTPTPTNTPIPAMPVDTVTLVPVIEGVFSRPVYLTHAFDDRLFIVEQAGVIRILQDGQLVDEPFLDIQDRVGSTQLEQGLLSVAFHPDYLQNGRFFTNYTDKQGTIHVSSFLVSSDDPNLANANSEVILLSVEQPFPNHNGGQLKFGPDRYLYVSLGDGGSANDPLGNGQNPNTLLGSLLRMDVDNSDGAYAIPSTNPFVFDDTRRNEIWAWGLRNPWRFSFDRLTGDLFIGDVGQNLWEEIHYQPASSQGGENYGWNTLEASTCFQTSDCDSTGLEFPIFEYSHQEGCSITGGYMYRGHEFLALYGNYILADFCSGNIWRLFPESSGAWAAARVLDSDFVISSFGEDVDGELYLLEHVSGSIYQLQP